MKRGRKPKPEVSAKIAAIRRLSKDGASSNAATRRRIALITAERNLHPSETRALIKGRCLTLRHLGQFAEKHRVNLDWLTGGDLKGLLDTVRGCPSRPRQAEAPYGGGRPYTSEEFVEAIKQLDPKARKFITGYMRQLLDGGDAA
jgi:hypothetical protein